MTFPSVTLITQITLLCLRWPSLLPSKVKFIKWNIPLFLFPSRGPIWKKTWPWNDYERHGQGHSQRFFNEFQLKKNHFTLKWFWKSWWGHDQGHLRIARGNPTTFTFEIFFYGLCFSIFLLFPYFYTTLYKKFTFEIRYLIEGWISQ